MKYLIFFCLLFGNFNFYAQNHNSAEVTAPKIVCPVELGEAAGFGDKSVKFVKVISDSRCPTGATCIWQGEAKVLVEVYEGNELAEKREITISNPAQLVPLFELKNNSVQIDGLDPYPHKDTPASERKYILNLILTEL